MERAVGLVITLMLASDPIVRGTQVLNIFYEMMSTYMKEKSVAMVLLSENLILHSMG